jgi:hypothetical protein
VAAFSPLAQLAFPEANQAALRSRIPIIQSAIHRKFSAPSNFFDSLFICRFLVYIAVQFVRHPDAKALQSQRFCV